MRCVFLEGKSGSTPGGIIKGFTITGGYTFTNKTEGCRDCGGGIAGYNMNRIDENGLAVECDITENNAKGRGANVFCTTLLRCRVGKISSGENLDFYLGSKAIDSLFDGSVTLYRNIHFYNCTFAANSARIYSNGYDSYARNCLFLRSGYDFSHSNRIAFSNCCFRAEKPTSLSASPPYFNDDCRFGLDDGELAMSGGNQFRPTGASVLADEGDLAQYLSSTNGWLKAWQDEFTLTDYFGRPRLTDGKLAIGCGQNGGDRIYADAEHGDDSNDGSSAASAVKTLARAVALSIEGDTICAAEGVYSNGSMFVTGTCSNRVVVPPGRKLVASGRRAYTVIEGALATDAGGPNLNGCGTNALRCVYVQAGANGFPGGVVKGFTLRNGRTYPNVKDGVITQTESNDTLYNCGGGAAGGGLVVNCEFTNCGSSSRGPNAHNVTLLRCRLGATACGGLDCYNGCRMVDCFYNNPVRIYQNPSFYNCTFGSRAAKAYSLSAQEPCVNCLFLSKDSSMFGPRMHYTNCIARCAWPTTSPDQADYDAATCRFGVSAGEVACVDGARPWQGSIVLGAGDLAKYLQATNGWHASWREEFNLTDLGGFPRVVNGKISVGCFEYAEMYVSPDGDDANDGLTPATAKQTPAGAVASGYEALTVKLAAGTYDKKSTVAKDLATRVWVPQGWAFEGAGRGQTVILGEADEDTQNLGPKAVRCAMVEKNAYLRGVTLKDGRTDDLYDTGDKTFDNSVAAGVYLLGALVDSEITGCKCGRGQGSDRRGSAEFGGMDNDGTMIRCYIHDNLGTLDVFKGSLISSTFKHSTYYGEGLMLNSWIGGDIKIMGWSWSYPAYNCVVLGEIGRGYMATNCVIGKPFTYYVDTKNAAYTNNGFDVSTCYTNVGSAAINASMDANLRPLKTAIMVDAGNRDYYHEKFPEKWECFADGGDVVGGERILNGQIDIGAGEYNWMDDFAAVISPRHAEVTEAGEDVAVADGALVFSPGDTLTAVWSSTNGRWATFSTSVSGGALTVTLNGAAISPQNGTYHFRLEPGANTLAFAYAGSGTARAFDFAAHGFSLILR